MRDITPEAANRSQPVGGWASPGPMNGTDTLFWRMNANPLTRSHVTWLWYLDQEPDWESFLEGCKWILAKLPRLTHRVVDTPARAGTPAWIADPDFRLARHVHRMRLPDPAGQRELLDLVEWRNSTDFDLLHPPWEATLVEGYERGRAAIILKWHHSIGDAVTIVAAMNRLLPDSVTAGLPDPVPPSDGRTVAPPQPSLSWAARGVVDGIRAAVRGAGLMLSSPGRAGERSRLLGRFGAQVFQPIASSPLLRDRSSASRIGMVTVPLADLKAVGKAAGVSVTSAYVAAVLEAFGRYHEHHGVFRRSLPTLVPVNIREPSETGAGNIIASVRIAGPIGDMSALARMARVHAAITEARDVVVRDVYTTLADLGSWVPGPIHQWLVPPMLRSAVDLVVTSVPGFSRDTYAAGARVVNAVAWAPRGAAAANMTLLSHEGTCTVGTNLDPAAVPDTDFFHHCLEQSLNDLAGI
ncbi:wax ester/triacylglycerol synthase domain-containing protein [Streptomyces sp. NPDC097107]|uniref:wax ester/triacylglycerol synthase domain-containing protein n=1 Tax=Streptomyces sp. NPDC097107 TaxID=3366089 RepID=UPI003828158E